MNAQEVFDKVATHLLTQKKRSIDSKKGCLYRGPDGLKCAVGCLIPDEEYDPVMEVGITALLTGLDYLIGKPVVSSLREHLTLLTDLQLIHDAHEPLVWKEQLKKTARHFSLNAGVLDTL